ncbi:IucA/IucC family protein (plasmid) [Escherichia coli]|nr:IucA/IucC family protein [Escherichia coli]
MIKFSLSVRLTNSIRTLSVKEVKRGMRLARLAQTTAGRCYRSASRLSG